MPAKCFNCGKTGHIASVCRAKRKPRPQPQQHVEKEPQENLLDLNAVQGPPDAAEPKAILKMSINTKEVSMEGGRHWCSSQHSVSRQSYHSPTQNHEKAAFSYRTTATISGRSCSESEGQRPNKNIEAIRGTREVSIIAFFWK